MKFTGCLIKQTVSGKDINKQELNKIVNLTFLSGFFILHTMKANRILYFLTGLLLLSIAAYFMTLWIIVAGDETISFEQTKAEYYELLPTFLRKRVLFGFFKISLLSIAAFLFYKCIKANFLKKISWVVFVLSLLLAYWNLFSLM